MLGIATDDDVTHWRWHCIQPVAGLLRAVVLAAGGRQAPVGVAAAEVNWCCKPGDAGNLATFTAGELAALQADGRALGAALDVRGGYGAFSFVAGSGGAMQMVAMLGAPLPVVAAAAGGAVLAPPGLAAAIGHDGGGGGVAAAGADAALGFPAVGGTGNAMDMAELSRLVGQMRDQLRHRARSESSESEGQRWHDRRRIIRY